MITGSGGDEFVGKGGAKTDCSGKEDLVRGEEEVLLIVETGMRASKLVVREVGRLSKEEYKGMEVWYGKLCSLNMT